MTAVSLQLDGKIALISGGSRGIGAETVRLFTQAGARVAFSYRKARKQAEALAAECGGPGRCAALDLSSAADGRALVASAVATFGRLDILVANHGIWKAEDTPIAEMAEAQWRQTLAVNLDAVFGLVQAAVTQMERQAAPVAGEAVGHIVLISSTAGQRGEADPVTWPKIVAGIPVGRAASAREIAGPVLFLCTPLAGFISGEVLNVNGGSVLVG